MINYTVYKASGVVNAITAMPSATSGPPSFGRLTVRAATAWQRARGQPWLHDHGP
ncbi:MAG: hypothetical protein ACM3ML_39300 [Micromonosporaceae bacterium]